MSTVIWENDSLTQKDTDATKPSPKLVTKDLEKDNTQEVVGEKIILDDTNAPKVLVYRNPRKEKFVVPDATEYKKQLRRVHHIKMRKLNHEAKKEMMKNFREGYKNKQDTITLYSCTNTLVPNFLKLATKLFAEKGYNVSMARDGNLLDVAKSICLDKSYQCRIVLTV
jgi:hypothetical protein